MKKVKVEYVIYLGLLYRFNIIYIRNIYNINRLC